MARPTADDIAFARKHRRQKRRGRAPSFAALRLANMYALFRDRYGDALPDDDAGRDDLRRMLDHLAGSSEAERRMSSIARAWAPWMPDVERDQLIAAVIAKPRRYRADTLAVLLHVTDAERQRLRLWTIGSVDRNREQRIADRKARRRQAEQQRRRAAGARPRHEYLATCREQRDVRGHYTGEYRGGTDPQ